MYTLIVAPHTGAWIEIYMIVDKVVHTFGRSPHGSVDWNPFEIIERIKSAGSLPTRERGLKLS